MSSIKYIVGLGNPGPQYYYQRHSIGFRVLDALAEQYHAPWVDKKKYATATITAPAGPVVLVKPLTFMNTSGTVLPNVIRQGTSPADIVVVHDELEKPTGTISWKIGGSHKGHNGLKSIIEYIGPDFTRLRIGISRPADRQAVPDYVLAPFELDSVALDDLIARAVQELAQKIS